jgi:hypothetical protein
MILYLDPLPYMDFYHHEFHTLNDRYKALALSILYDELATLPDDIIELISKIYIINFRSSEYSVTRKTVQLFSKYIKANPRLKLLTKLFNDADYNDCFEILNFKMMELIVFNNYNIFFDQTLTRDTIKTLLSCLKPQKTLGFRRVSGKKETEWEQILDLEKYLNIAYTLTVSPDDNLESLKSNPEILRQNIEAENEVILHVMEKPCSKLSVLVNEDDFKTYQDFIQNLKLKFGPFAIVECSNQGYNLIPNKENLIVKNIERLLPDKLTELCSEILNGEYKNKRVVLHSTKPLDLSDFPEIFRHILLPAEILGKIYVHKLEFKEKKLSTVDKLSNDFESYLKQTTSKPSEVKKGLKQIAELKSVHGYLDIKKTNFWYDLDSLNYPKYEELVGILEDEYDKYFNVNKQSIIFGKSIKIRIVHNTKIDKWSIEINDEKIKNISYQNSLGMKYLAYLIKHYQDGKTIKDKDLLAVVRKWHNKGKGSKKNSSKPAAHSIDQALHYLYFTQCPELYPLKRYVKITDIDPGCWYEDNLFIDCAIIDDQMPPKN